MLQAASYLAAVHHSRSVDLLARPRWHPAAAAGLQPPPDILAGELDHLATAAAAGTTRVGCLPRCSGCPG